MLSLNQNGKTKKVPLLHLFPFFLPLFSFFPLHCRIFLSLMEEADLTDLLKQEGDFTLFAPSDKAFARVTERDLALLKSRSLKGFCLCFNHYSFLLFY